MTFIEHGEAGAAIGSSEERYRDLVENSNELIWSADAFGRWTFVNGAARRIYGCAPEEMIGRPMTDWMIPGERRAISGRSRESSRASATSSTRRAIAAGTARS